VVAYGGKLWGMTSFDGGGINKGTIIEFDPLSPYTVTKKHTFTTTGGHQPFGTLLVYNNKFYGLTTQGGTAANNPGVLFEYDPATSTYTTRTEFVFTNGATPYNSLIVAPTGGTPLGTDDVAFTAVKEGGKAVLRWNCSDNAAKDYTVERSATAVTFDALGTLQNTASEACSFVDATPVTGDNFYRLRLRTSGGAVTYSPVRTLRFDERASGLVLYHDGDAVVVKTSISSGTVHLFSATGSRLGSAAVVNGAARLDVGGLAPGVYLVVLEEGGVRKGVARIVVGR
jgi:uncharacterized repeat protein (TIGR03803 family)